MFQRAFGIAECSMYAMRSTCDTSSVGSESTRWQSHDSHPTRSLKFPIIFLVPFHVRVDDEAEHRAQKDSFRRDKFANDGGGVALQLLAIIGTSHSTCVSPDRVGWCAAVTALAIIAGLRGSRAWFLAVVPPIAFFFILLNFEQSTEVKHGHLR